MKATICIVLAMILALGMFGCAKNEDTGATTQPTIQVTPGTSPIGYGFTSAATFMTLRKERDGSKPLRINAILGTTFALIFIVILLSPASLGFGGLSTPARIALVIWCVLGAVFFLRARKAKQK